jgi:hypothetical protein
LALPRNAPIADRQNRFADQNHHPDPGDPAFGRQFGLQKLYLKDGRLPTGSKRVGWRYAIQANEFG